jgi:glucosamine 6-phosphate synthetase-like amidotransferase/phosphosugar isomerase protein
MCGIAGYSLSPASRIDRTLAAQTLLAAIAERGSDAVGYAHRDDSGPRVTVAKQRGGAGALLGTVHVPGAATQLLVHVRDFTKGHPRISSNNHPIRHGEVVGIHNGIIFNDEEIIAEHGFTRADPQMTVDSEAIFALAELRHSDPRALEELRGSMAAAWLDERDREALFLARGVGRPLWIGVGRHEVAFASTLQALEVMERYTNAKLRKREVEEGTLLRVEDGRIAATARFRPDRSYVEETLLPSVRAPHEGASCLQRLAAIALAA